MAGLHMQEKAPKQFMTFMMRTKLAPAVRPSFEAVNRFGAAIIEKGRIRQGFSASFSYLG
ncbi:MAG TPA: hypothetical protein ENI30_10025 [Gammaproteobacteria bacterium]|jgi:hypothetical protein|nr:hypothetical protein C0058_09695 [Pseudomonas sp. NC02]PMU16845.1 hypothetical protein C1X90_26895 [Pseudomonas sp. GP01-A9]PMU23966.1 hypothetical protein C1X88_26155 [Pseudomonas sp. GP01-A13]PMU33756.1 hypothetical protein C1X89_26660 [Pseudomonas sp. GP01-A8]PMU48719.1 hypothetical protein C1X85_29215 [Pseudomonas sp. GP01-A6]PMU48938.1 hypothetical protein C1X87_18595 [Pseudomonas sp. GP01-A14]PMU59856.1 hypothetical protein C1X86_26370 [Pseudomonas sp. GP01-A3]PMU68281.1 hypothetica